ncbi:MAG: hypothetical protein WBM32_04780, partial [Crocosphaera sp.]
MRRKFWLLISLLTVLFICLKPMPTLAVGGGGAFGVPGAPSVWTFAGKTGIGTSYEAYLNKQ